MLHSVKHTYEAAFKNEALVSMRVSNGGRLCKEVDGVNKTTPLLHLHSLHICATIQLSSLSSSPVTPALLLLLCSLFVKMNSPQSTVLRDQGTQGAVGSCPPSTLIICTLSPQTVAGRKL